MVSVQDRLQLKREPLDKWSLREQLCLASAVARSGDQNWMSVSRALKPFGESNRPSDWFHQKNCAAQYGSLLRHVETPKRKKRAGGETVVETSAESVLRKLLVDRQLELKTLLAEEKAEYKKLQEDMKLLQTGRVSEEQLDIWCKEIDEEELRREQEASNYAKFLKERDLRKQEIERAWRPFKPGVSIVAQKRKLSDIDDPIDSDRDNNLRLQQQNSVHQFQQYMPSTQDQLVTQSSSQISSDSEIQAKIHANHVPTHESVKPALSPLLTSLLKSPSQMQNLSPVSSSILHTVITSQNNRTADISNVSSASSPTITSLLNSSTSASVTSSLQNLSTCSLDQEINNLPNDDQPLNTDILDEASIKIDDLAKSIFVQDGPFPEIRKEEVDDIISEIIENAHDIVADPEQHLQLDGNGDININIELDDLEADVINNENIKINAGEAEKVKKSPLPIIDPFEFQEDPILFESPVKPSSLKLENQQYVPLYQQSPIKNEEVEKKLDQGGQTESHDLKIVENYSTSNIHGSVEIVEVPSEEVENEKQLNKAQICDIVHSDKEKEVKVDSGSLFLSQSKLPQTSKYENEVENLKKEDQSSSCYFGPTDTSDTINTSNQIQNDTISEYPDDLYDNINMEVKIDKTGKTKRDYSRTKKKEGKGVDMLLAIERAHFDDINLHEDVEFRVDGHKRVAVRLKSEQERSRSPWTEEEDGKANKRRYSTSGTPIDSLPNSPASSIVYYDDDKDYRNWKKSVMLVYNRLASNKYASLFLKPISDDQAPGYSSVVNRPMDLQTIKKNIDSGIIRTSLEFKRDVMLMFTNALMYNKTYGTIYNMALLMQQESIHPIEILLEAEGQVDAPIRRETRTSESYCKRKRIPDDCIKIKKRKED